MSASIELPAKRQKVAEPKCVNEVLTDEFASTLVSMYHGPLVKIIVGEKQYILSKPLLCHCSHFFNGAFKTGFKEGETQELTLDPAFASFFLEGAIQRIYTGNLVFSPKIASNTDRIFHLLDFLKVADFLGIAGPFISIIAQINSLLKDTRGLALISAHIAQCMALPSGHDVRQEIAKACVAPYLESLGWYYEDEDNDGVDPKISPFKYSDALVEVDGFAAEFFKVFDITMRAKRDDSVTDPLTGISTYCTLQVRPVQTQFRRRR